MAAQSVQLPQAYLDAVADAQRVDARKNSRSLIAITPYERGLVWRLDSSGSRRVKVAMWVGEAADNNAPKYRVGAMTAPAGYDDETLIWVTAVPELKTFCSKYRAQGNGPDLILRIQQVLGLPPARVDLSYVVEFWVFPNDLLRPTPDPDVTGHKAELGLSISSKLVSINQDYENWFIRHKNTVYTRAVPGTWTRLGYTYDWGCPQNPVGLCEFIIRPQASIEVAGISSTTQYCHSDSENPRNDIARTLAAQ
jgi:hypothetical protein